MNVLLVAAHPDDADFVCGGTIAWLVDEGASVTYLVVSSGELGEGGSAAHREAEQRSAASVLGVRSISFLGFPDGTLEPSIGLRAELTAAFREQRPDLVITHAPDRNLESIRFSHPDHLAVGSAALAAVYPDSRNPGAHSHHRASRLPIHVVPEVWLFGLAGANHVIDISETFDKKVDAVNCHSSQLGEFLPSPREFFGKWASEIAESHGLAGRRAEHYMRLDTR